MLMLIRDRLDAENADCDEVMLLAWSLLWNVTGQSAAFADLVSALFALGIFSQLNSTPPSRSNKAGLKCPSVHPYVRPQKVSSISLKFGSGRRVMYDGMQYDPIQGQCHEPLKVRKSTIFKHYYITLHYIRVI